MATVSGDARTGKARLCLVINDEVYACRKMWRKVRLRKVSGDRAGSIYWIAREGRSFTCTCPDAMWHPSTRCKHVGAVLASKLLSTPKGGAL